MKMLSTLLFACLLMLACTPKQPDKVATENNSAVVADSVKDGVFIHITESYNDPHRVLMPLKMALIMSKDKDVLVYLDIHAVELVTKTSKDMEFAGFDPLKKMLNDLIAAKVGIYACPTCLKVAGLDPTDLMDGVQAAQKDKFFNFTKGRIITLDY